MRIEKGQLHDQSPRATTFGFVPDGSDPEMWVHVGVGNSRYCSSFGARTVEEN